MLEELKALSWPLAEFWGEGRQQKKRRKERVVKQKRTVKKRRGEAR
jgi:hypothetical protein